MTSNSKQRIGTKHKKRGVTKKLVSQKNRKKIQTYMNPYRQK